MKEMMVVCKALYKEFLHAYDLAFQNRTNDPLFLWGMRFFGASILLFIYAMVSSVVIVVVDLLRILFAGGDVIFLALYVSLRLVIYMIVTLGVLSLAGWCIEKSIRAQESEALAQSIVETEEK